MSEMPPLEEMSKVEAEELAQQKRRNTIETIRMWIGLAIALYVLATFGMITKSLFDHLENYSDKGWTRAVFLYSGIQSLVVGATGFFFGREVNRGAVAEARGQTAEEKAKVKELAKEVNGIADDLEGGEEAIQRRGHTREIRERLKHLAGRARGL